MEGTHTTKILLSDVRAKVIGRYSLTTAVKTIVPGVWYDVAVGPFRKNATTVTAIRAQAAESFKKGELFVRMRNELGGLIDIRKDNILREAGKP
jgi:hypothetical protein